VGGSKIKVVYRDIFLYIKNIMFGRVKK